MKREAGRIPLEPRGIFRIVWEAFRLYCRYFPLLLVCGGGIALFLRIIQWALGIPPVSGLAESEGSLQIPAVLAIGFAGVSGLVGYPISAALTTIALVRLLRGADASIPEVVTLSGPVLKPVLVTNLLLTLLLLVPIAVPGYALYAVWSGEQGGPVAVGLVILLVAGVVFSIICLFRYPLIVEAVTLDGTTPRSAFDRSGFLMDGQKVRYFVLLVLQQVVIGLLNVVVPSSRPVVAEVVSLLLGPAFLIATVLFYLDVRIRSGDITFDGLAAEYAGPGIDVAQDT